LIGGIGSTCIRRVVAAFGTGRISIVMAKKQHLRENLICNSAPKLGSSLNMALQITTPFAIPVALARHPDHENLNAALRKLFLEREQAGDRYANRTATMQINPELYESRFDLFKWPEASIGKLREFCWENLYKLIYQFNNYDEATLRRMLGHSDAWFHITRRGGYFGLHNHPMASWSGVYCVDAGRSDATRRDSGLLSFPHPCASSAMFIDAATAKMKLPYSYGTREYRLDPGELVLFPSWLLHQVTPFQGDGERITVAFNAWFTLDD
jgi:uncharacterized protein (TIGR02466 family)